MRQLPRIVFQLCRPQEDALRRTARLLILLGLLGGGAIVWEMLAAQEQPSPAVTGCSGSYQPEVGAFAWTALSVFRHSCGESAG